MRVIAQVSHHFELICQSFFSLICRKTTLFGKSLNCKLFTIFYAFYFIDSGKVALSQFSQRFELLMESFLMNQSAEMFDPYFHNLSWAIEGTAIILLSIQFKSNFRTFSRILSGKGSTLSL